MAITNYGELKTAVDLWGKWGGIHDSRIVEWIAMSEDWIGRNMRVKAMEASVDVLLKATTVIAASGLGGTANAITITNDTTLSSNSLADTYKFTAEATNTSTVTVNVDGIGAVALNKDDGTIGLEANDIISGQNYYIYYDGTRFRLLPHPGSAPLPSRWEAARRLYIPGDPVKRLRYSTPINFYSKYISSNTAKPTGFTIEGFYLVFGETSDSTYAVKTEYYRKPASFSGDSDTNWFLSNARGLYLYGGLVEGYAYLEDQANLTKYAAMRDAIAADIQKADEADRFSGDALIIESDVPVD